METKTGTSEEKAGADVNANSANEIDGLREAIKQRITKLPSETSTLKEFTEIIIKFYEETVAKEMELSVIIDPSSIIMVQVKGKDQKRRCCHANDN